MNYGGVNPEALAGQVHQTIIDVLQQQVQAGFDISDDGDMSRRQLVASFKENPDVHAREAQERGLTLHAYFNVKSPIPEPRHPVDALDHILWKSDLHIGGNNPFMVSSKLDAFKDRQTSGGIGYKNALFWATLDRDYDSASTVKDVGWKLNEAAQSQVSQISPGSALNPRYWRSLYERNKFRPPLAISDITSTVETIDDIYFEQPNYDTDANSEQPRQIPEGGTIPTVLISSSKDRGETEKIGLGVRFSKEFANNAMRMAMVRLWVMRQALRDEVYMVNSGVNLLYDTTQESGGRTEDIGATLNLDSILDVQLYFGAEEGYALDLLVARKPEAKKWIKANIAAGDSTSEFNRSPNESGRFGGVLGEIQLVNEVMGPTRLAYVGGATAGTDVNAGTKIPEDKMLGVDSRFGLVFYQAARGLMLEEQYKPQEQVNERYMTRRFGWARHDEKAVVLFSFA